MFLHILFLQFVARCCFAARLLTLVGDPICPVDHSVCLSDGCFGFVVPGEILTTGCGAAQVIFRAAFDQLQYE